MKRIFIVLAVISWALVGCSNESNKQTESSSNSNSIENVDLESTEYETVNNLDGVTMVAKEQTVSPAGLTVVFENNTNKHIIYGVSYLLEKKINERWYQVPVIIEGEYDFVDEGFGLGALDKQELKVDWDWLYGSLDSGEYRIVKDIDDFRDAGDYDTYYLAAGFTIK